MYLLIKDLYYHPKNKSKTGKQYLFNNNNGLIYPDFISHSKERIIADAKYKPIENISNKDYLQVLAYMFRYDAKIGYYLYPETNDNEDTILWMNKGITYERNVRVCNDICVIKHGLKIPVNTLSYEEFVHIIKLNEIEFKSQLTTRR